MCLCLSIVSARNPLLIPRMRFFFYSIMMIRPESFPSSPTRTKNNKTRPIKCDSSSLTLQWRIWVTILNTPSRPHRFRCCCCCWSFPCKSISKPASALRLLNNMQIILFITAPTIIPLLIEIVQLQCLSLSPPLLRGVMLFCYVSFTPCLYVCRIVLSFCCARPL